MNKIEALEHINEVWNNDEISLKEKIISISDDFYSVGLDIPTTAAYIKATPAELDALLSLSALDEEIIEIISKVQPPKTTWALLANASEVEIKQAVSVLEHNNTNDLISRDGSPVSQYVYQRMLEVAGPTPEKLVGMLSGNDLEHVLKKGIEFKEFSDWELKFFKSIVSQKKRGKTLSRKQITQIIKILNVLADHEVVVRNSIDGDNEICDRILDAIGR